MNEGIDEDITLVKKRAQSRDKSKHLKSPMTEVDRSVCVNSEISLSLDNRDKSTQTLKDNEQRSQCLLKENEDLQTSLKELLAQTKELKNENQSLLKLVESKDQETKTLRSKYSDIFRHIFKEGEN